MNGTYETAGAILPMDGCTYPYPPCRFRADRNGRRVCEGTPNSNACHTARGIWNEFVAKYPERGYAPSE